MLSNRPSDLPITPELIPSIPEVSQEFLSYIEWIIDTGIEYTDDVIMDLRRIATVMFNYVTGSDSLTVMDAAFYERLLNPIVGIIGEFKDCGVGLNRYITDGKYHFSIVALRFNVEFELVSDWTAEAILSTGVSETSVN